MIVNPLMKKAIVFLGTGDVDNITWKGTGFLLVYKGFPYLVTCEHNVRFLGRREYWIRVNSNDAGASALVASGSPQEVPWIFHPDRSVDLAVVPFNAQREENRDHMYLPEDSLAPAAKRSAEGINLGDATYTWGLFHKIAGKVNNAPILHVGNLVGDFQDGKVSAYVLNDLGVAEAVEAERFVVQTHSLRGLSGSPVFVRPSVRLDDLPVAGKELSVLLPRSAVFLLGMWTSAFDEKPSDVLAEELNQMGTPAGSARVGLGMGLVTPVDRIVELLESETVQKARNQSKPDTTKQS